MMKANTLEKIVCNNSSAIGLFDRVNRITDDMMEGIVKEINDLTVEWFFWAQKEINGAMLVSECPIPEEDTAVIAEVNFN